VCPYLQELNLPTKHQYGFSPRATTAHAVETIHSILNSVIGLYACSIIIDLSQAFFWKNSIWKVVLQLWCKRNPTTTIPQLVFKCQISVTKYILWCDTNVSSCFSCKYFFRSATKISSGATLVYVNDLQCCSTLKPVLCADDTYLSLSHTNVHFQQDIVNPELTNVDKWMCLNKLSINNSKSVYMLTRSMKYLRSPN